ncbi:MAG TPA: PIG-L family deacetylase [Saprospiraceae bacterium]|nr:PIG-L family deacetylase [Saprospiraceae bacterium]HMQ84701.1 PIG-L family deacetylase [Saprospiraceae bacterium]
MAFRLTAILLFATVFSWTLQAQAPKKWSAADIHQGIQKLSFLGSALYVAAHPDDENTRLITYLANEVKAETAYLSLTRGDGGQNLIGTEIQELLGVIRTQELLAARRTDGGTQFFSRANDFGYSKHPDETFNIWQRDDVLADVVWAIRKWQPDVIINRFDHNSAGRTHGHHTGSAILAFEAFDLAGKKEAYPEQLAQVDAWQPQRLFFNTSWWFYGSQEAFDKADKTNMMSVDVGGYYPERGQSYGEIAADSRSMHKSQGFGSAGARGSQSEYLLLLKGDMPVNKENLFDGINTSWTRVKGGEKVGKLLAEVEKNFNFSRPYASVPGLIAAYREMQGLEDGHWKQVKIAEIKEVILACMGLFAEVTAADYWASPGETVKLNVEMVNRSPQVVQIGKITFLPSKVDSLLNLSLEFNQKYQFSYTLPLSEQLDYSTPYWLGKPHPLGMYNVEDQALRGLPETPRRVSVQFVLEIEGETLSFVRDVVYKETDSVKGEVYRPFEVIPPVFANMAKKVYVFASDQPQEIEVVVKAGQANIKGQLSLDHPKSWRIEPAVQEFELKLKGEEARLHFQVFPPNDQQEAELKATVVLNGRTYDDELIVVAYDHIPTQTVVQENQAKIVRVDLKKAGEKVGYIMGAGDEVADYLTQMGYEVTNLSDEALSSGALEQYDAIVVGIRAYNTNERMKFHQTRLMQYVENGGTLVVQYNTTSDLVMPADQIGPYPFKISRDRVSVETASVNILVPNHPLLNTPNKITEKDFEGWIQERGLYFPNEWDERYTALLSCNDPDEPARNGGLLVAQYGKGYYIYTGYSWFRELPAGVPGAFRLFANLVSLGN